MSAAKCSLKFVSHLLSRFSDGRYRYSCYVKLMVYALHGYLAMSTITTFCSL